MWFRGKGTENAPLEPSERNKTPADTTLEKQSLSQPSQSKTQQRRRRSRPQQEQTSEHGAIARERKNLQKVKISKALARTAAPPKKQTSRRVTPSQATKQQARNYRGDSAVAKRPLRRGRFAKRGLLVACAIALVAPFILLHQHGLDSDSTLFLRLSQATHQQSKSSSELQQSNISDSVLFIPKHHIDDNKDLFSASWLVPISTFLGFDTSRENLQTNEAASFALFKKYRQDVQMTLDWLDFSVEHLSSWWDASGVLKDNALAHHVIVSKCYEYIRNIQLPMNSTTMNDVIAVVAFEPIVSRKVPETANELSVTALAATIASLVQVGFGRVVVVGYHVEDTDLAHEAFSLLHSLVPRDFTSSGGSNNDNDNNNKIGPTATCTEFGYVRADTQDVISLKTPINIVKGALTGLQNAFKGELSIYDTEEWLGTSRDAKSRYKYVYLTEFDTILQTKPSSLPHLKDALQQGSILAPHRLQILPHEYDLGGMSNKKKMVQAEGEFANVTVLNSHKGSACCDTLTSDKPWKAFPKCGSFWWQCGFSNNNKGGDHPHSRLKSYSLIRLKPGMNVVTLAANHNGRQCQPKVSGTCTLPIR